MPLTTTRTSNNGRQASNGAAPSTPRGRPVARHRQVPMVVVGVLLVIGCALAFTDASLHLGNKEEVLVVNQPLAAGQVLTSSDLGTAQITTGRGVEVVPVSEESTMVGRHVAVPLVAGALLTTGEVGSPPPVGSGSDVVAVGLKVGAFPPALAPGDRVQIVPVATATSASGDSGGAAAGSPIAATVLAIAAASAGSGSPTVFSLEVPSADADEVAELAAAGQVSLVQLGAGS